MDSSIGYLSTHNLVLFDAEVALNNQLHFWLLTVISSGKEKALHLSLLMLLNAMLAPGSGIWLIMMYT